MSHPSEDLKGNVKQLHETLRAKGRARIRTGLLWLAGSIFFALVAAFGTEMNKTPQQTAVETLGGFILVCFFVLLANLFLIPCLLSTWRGMQYFNASTNLIVQLGSHAADSSRASPPQNATSNDRAYDYSFYAELPCGVDMQDACATPIPNHSYPCEIDTAGKWVITSPIGRIHVHDTSKIDFDAIRSGKARLETSSKMELDSHGRLKATLSMPQRKLTSNANAA